MIGVGSPEIPEVAEEFAADEVDFFPVVHGGVSFEAVVEDVEGAAQGGSAPHREWFGLGHSVFLVVNISAFGGVELALTLYPLPQERGQRWSGVLSM